MTFEPECEGEWSAWVMDQYCGMLQRRKLQPKWVSYDADGIILGGCSTRRAAIQLISDAHDIRARKGNQA